MYDQDSVKSEMTKLASTFEHEAHLDGINANFYLKLETAAKTVNVYLAAPLEAYGGSEDRKTCTVLEKIIDLHDGIKATATALLAQKGLMSLFNKATRRETAARLETYAAKVKALTP